MSLATRFATALAFAGLCLVPTSAAAQAVTGTILGNINDSSGGAVPGVSVTATEVQTNVSRSAVTEPPKPEPITSTS